MAPQAIAVQYRFIVILLCIPVFLCSQDIIYRNNEVVIAAQIQEWNKSTVQYLQADKSDTRVHYLSTQYIDSIRFQDGQVKRFNTIRVVETDFNQVYRRTYVGVGLLDPIAYSNLRFTYERRLGAGSTSLFIPLTIGLVVKDKNNWESGIIYRIGAGFNFHVPRKRGNSLYVIGLGLHAGSLKRFDYYHGNPERTFVSHAFVSLVNSHSLNIRINDNLIFAPGVDLQLIGYAKNYYGYGNNVLPVIIVFRLNFLYNL